ncbi:MAG: hypothetical protein FJ388_05980 [Verrucomicrobia bacterium]|nr:hypothetical protein [Verrucomicrobiota bacterium]
MRQSTSPHPKPALFSRRYEIGAVAAFLLIAIPIAYYSSDERSAFIAATNCVAHGTAVTGYTEAAGNRLLFIENEPFVDQVVVFNGAPSPLDMYAVRGLYAYLVSFFAPFLGYWSAFFLVNCLSWAGFVYAVWRFTRGVFQDPLAAFLAALLACAGLGMVVHAADYSAHLLSFTLYAVGVLLIFESGVWTERRPFRTHLLIGLFLALASLNYNNGLMLLGGYVAVALWWNSPLHVGTAAAIAYSSQVLWEHFLNVVNMWLNREPSWVEFSKRERGFFRSAFSAWLSDLQQGPLAFLETLARKLTAFAIFENPFVLVVGLVAAILLLRQRKRYWFFAVFLLVPMAAGKFYMRWACTRGYLIYGVSILFYAAAAMGVSRLLRGRSWVRLTGAALLALVVLGHFWWNTAHFRGNLGPAVAFLRGPRSLQTAVWIEPRIINMTGHEPVPRQLGGTSRAEEGGMFVPRPATTPIWCSAIIAAFARSFYLLYLVPLVLLLPLSRATRGYAVLACLAITVGVSAIGRWALRERPAVRWILASYQIPPGTHLEHTVRLSPRFVEALKEALRTETTSVEFGIGLARDAVWTVKIGDQLMDTQPGKWPHSRTMSKAAFLEAINRSSEVSLVAENPTNRMALLSGWQRNGLQDRKLTGFECPVLPLFEIRARQANGVAAVVGF